MGDAQQQANVPIFEVAVEHSTWWSYPKGTSAILYQEYASGKRFRAINWRPNGDTNGTFRYGIDFAAGVQTNMDDQRQFPIRFIWVRPQDVVPELMANAYHLNLTNTGKRFPVRRIITE